MVDGKIDRYTCAKFAAEKYVDNFSMCYTVNDLMKIYTNELIQPPKLVEKLHPELNLSGNWIMPYGLDPATLECLVYCVNYLDNADEINNHIYNEFERLNPLLKEYDLLKNENTLIGLTSNFNADDIYEFQTLGGAHLRPHSFTARVRYIESRLNVKCQWVLSEKTLKYIEEAL